MSYFDVFLDTFTPITSSTGYKLFINNNNVSNFVGNLEWSDDLDTLATEFNFKSIKPYNVGDKFRLTNNGNEVIRGILTDSERDMNNIFSLKAYDYGWFLNKNEVLIQFNGVSADTAIKQLLNKFQLPTGNIPYMSTIIKKIYKDVILSDVIKDILEQVYKKNGIKYKISCENGKVNIIQNRKDVITAYYQLSSNTDKFDITKALGNFTTSSSIQEMKNKIVIVDNSENSTRIKQQSQDTVNIAKFGLLQQVETADNDKNNPSEQAKTSNTLLKELNKIAQTCSVELFGSDEIKSGKLLKFNYPELDFTGNYEIKSSKHTLSDNLHKVSLDLTKV
jgi:hypothetical protein